MVTSNPRPELESAHTFRCKLNELFNRARISPTNKTVARGLREFGHPISTAYLSQLRSGARDNPSNNVILGLSKYFRVHESFFFTQDPSASTENDDSEILIKLTDRRIRYMLNLANGLSTHSQELLIEMADRISELDHIRTNSTR